MMETISIMEAISRFRTPSIAIVVLIPLLFGGTVSQRLTVVPVNDPFIISVHPPNYSYGDQTVDIIWNISYPAEITITEFNVDVQSGEFAVICEYPLPNEEKFSDGAAAEEAIRDLPLENSLLLTTDVLRTVEDPEGNTQRKLTVRIANDKGGFIYFHGVPADPSPKRDEKVPDSQTNITATDNRGFDVNVTRYDTEEPQTTPRPQPPSESDYITRYVTGLTPLQVVNMIQEIRDTLAEMANNYTSNYSISLARPFEDSDVLLDNSTMYFCDKTITNYSNCVQIKFAITGVDDQGEYVMKKDRLVYMWGNYSGFLQDLKLGTIEDPVTENRINTWVWVAAFLGVILVVGALVAVLISKDPLQSRPVQARKRSNSPYGVDQTSTGSGSGGADTRHPLFQLAEGIAHEREQDDMEYKGLTGRDRSTDGSSSTRTNPLSRSGFDNSAFEDDDEPRPSTSYINSRVNSISTPQSGTLRVPGQPQLESDDEKTEFERINIHTGLDFA